MKTAGMVKGTPDWQLDRMYETDTAEALEKAYAQDDFPISDVENEFDQASYFIGQAVRHLIKAADVSDKYGKAEMIDELIERLDDQFRWDMGQTVKKLKEGA